MIKLIFALLLLLPSLALSGCNLPKQEQEKAKDRIASYGCPTCHIIPGVPGAIGKVGPSLKGLENRSYIAGAMENNEGNVEKWIMHPQAFRPGSAMPEMGVTPEDSRLIARYLEKLE